MIRKPFENDICFVAPNAFPSLSGREDLVHIGGAERQQIAVARELARTGLRVCFVTHDHGQEDGSTFDGIRVFKTCARQAGLPVLRFIHPRWTGLWGAMNRANAAAYYQRTAGAETGQAAFWCRRRNRPFIVSIASDRDCTPSMIARFSRRERWLYLYGLRRADCVIAQTLRQKTLLHGNFAITARVIPSVARSMPAPGTTVEHLQGDPWPQRVLWIGRFFAAKRIDRLFEVARCCSTVAFEVIGGDRRGAIDFCRMNLRLDSKDIPANITFHGVVPDRAMSFHYASGSLLLCTSDYEGFPNTFLEAWTHGIPVVSTVDPDAVIQTHKLGIHARSVPEVCDAIQGMFHDRRAWELSSMNARLYVERFHKLSTAADAYRQVLRELGVSRVIESTTEHAHVCHS
ncbi:MAG TPA: glycosyltransferase family 4 protein [Phycisphaerae bacterium]|nr:glycosyltransferase family 4 protein [Phycisphaerae bacterium]